jgi:hypothetical protein
VELVDDAGHEWAFGTDDSEVRIHRFGGRQIVCRGEYLPNQSDAGVSGGSEYSMTFFGEPPRKGVFAATAADDKNSHDELPVYRDTLE